MDLPSRTFDLVIWQNVWPDEEPERIFPAVVRPIKQVDACNVGIIGTSLSGLDAAMAVAIQRSSFAVINNVIFTAITQVKAKYYVNIAHRYFAKRFMPIPTSRHIVTDQALNAEIQKKKAKRAFWIDI